MLVKDFYAGTSSGLFVFSNVLSVLGDKLIIAAADATTGTELWVSDGTTAGTTQIVDLNPGTGSGVSGGGLTPLTTYVVGSTYFFCGSEGVNGYELWKTNGTAAGTVLVKDIQPGANSSNAGWFGTFQGKLLMRADDGVRGQEPWISDGTAGGTYLLKDINVGSGGSSPLGFFNANDRVFFIATEPTTGGEPWVSDGTTNGTQLVKDINPGPSASWTVYGLAGKGRRCALVATEGISGNEHWISDGTAAGTVMLADLRPGPLGGASTGWFFAGDKWYVVANDGTTGAELWVYSAKQTGVASVENFGIACLGSNGQTPTISVVGAPVLGNLTFATKLDKARPSSLAMLCVGAGRTDFRLGTCKFYPSLPGPVVFTTTDVLGGSTVTVPLGLDPVLLGESAYFQWVVADPNGGWIGVASLTDALRIVIGTP